MATTMHAGTTRRGGGANHDGTPPRLTRVHATPRCNSGYPAFDECNVRRLPTLAERRLPSTKRTVVPTDSIGVTQTSCAQNQPTAYSNCDRNRNDDPSPHRAPRKPWCNSGHPASDECNALRLLSVTERRLPSTKRTVARTKSSNELHAKPTDHVQQLRRQRRRHPPHLTREPCNPRCHFGYPAFDECNALRLPSVTERRLPSTKRTVARTKSSRTTQTSCTQSQPTTCSNDDGIPRTSPGSHATPDAISAIQPPTNATHAVFQR